MIYIYKAQSRDWLFVVYFELLPYDRFLFAKSAGIPSSSLLDQFETSQWKLAILFIKPTIYGMHQKKIQFRKINKPIDGLGYMTNFGAD